jgi:Uma2 family endonuclease
MLAVKPKLMSVEEFLDWEIEQDQKWELVDGIPILRETRLMAGGTAKHAQIAANIMLAIGPQLRGGPCRVYGSDLKVRNAASARYPDVTVDCGTRAGAKTAETPRVVFEVLSPSNSTFQQTRLLADYQKIESIDQIVFVSQDAAEAQTWRRAANGWMLEDFDGLNAEITLPSISAVVTMADIYDGVAFEAVADPAQDE